MKDENLDRWFSINEYTKEDLKGFLDDGHQLIVHVANPDSINGNILFANYYHKTGWYVMDGFGGELEGAAITHWRYLPDLPY